MTANQVAFLQAQRWSLVVSVGVFVFWTFNSLVLGSKTTTDWIWFFSVPVFQLPFTFSRWFDIAIGPIWAFLLVFWPESNDVEFIFGHTKALIQTWTALGILVAGLNGLVFGLLSGIASAILLTLGITLLIIALQVGKVIINWASVTKN